RDFPGGFPGDRRNAFTREGRTAAENDVFNHLRRLALARARLPALRRGAVVHLHDGEQQTVFARTLDRREDAVIVAFNNDARPATIEFGVAPAGLRDGTRLYDRIGSAHAAVADGRLKITLPARSAGLLSAFAFRGSDSAARD
ncbi:MAG TPA: hypothetical protein VGV38_09415, partial [Pyrinomonadaceae bacterium]|nr:hypothetical protein [Pyrinomonadaceae bacterium]